MSCLFSERRYKTVRTTFSVLIEERGEGLVELVEGLEPGEDVVGTCEPSSHGLGHGHLLKRLVEDVGMRRDEFLRLVGGEDVDVERGPFLAEERGHESGESLGESCSDFVLLILCECDLWREAL